MAEAVINMDAIQTSAGRSSFNRIQGEVEMTVSLIFIVCILKSLLHTIVRVAGTLSFALPLPISPLLSFFSAYFLD